ncbi:MAG: hypothetical protein O3A95_02215 [Planctomycetota bacterium]|nr:hypothetical protein [Planctomycetota bacterium]MDA1113098.1 hypothetical protein [Planctomycetota bacterium]
MKKFLPLLAIPALAFTAINPDTSGPYTDSQGNSFNRLPQVSDFTTVAAFDATIGHETFTTRNGHQFQVDRELTPAELATALANQVVARAMQPRTGSGGTIAAVVTVNLPVDEEYRAIYGSTAALKTAVKGEIDDCDAALISNFGIDIVPSSGNAWDSNDSADIVQLLDEAFSEHGYGGKDMMIALSNDFTSGGAIGVGYIGLPRQLTKKYQGLEGEIMQHEAGHNYTLRHCNVGSCIMFPTLRAANLGNFHNFFESSPSGQNHFTLIDWQRNRY